MSSKPKRDDSDDSDDDYDPTKDPLAEEDDEFVDVEEVKLDELSHARSRKAMEAFDALNEEVHLETQNKVSASVAGMLANAKKKKNNNNDDKNDKKAKKVLSGIFGKTVATQLVSKSTTIVSGNNNFGMITKKENGINKNKNKKSNSILKELAMGAAKNIKKKEEVIEIRKFAGREIQVKKTIGAGESELYQSKSNKPQSSLEKVLADIKGPSGVSTVAKSSIDWDNYKEEEGLNDELRGVSKDGQLGKKDFLQRCDVRNFEIEKEQRLRNQTKDQNKAKGKK